MLNENCISFEYLNGFSCQWVQKKATKKQIKGDHKIYEYENTYHYESCVDDSKIVSNNIQIEWFGVKLVDARIGLHLGLI